MARESEVNSVIPDNLATTQELYTQINNELTDFQKVIAQDLVHPFESKSAIDKTFLENELNGFRGNWNSALNDLVSKGKRYIHVPIFDRCQFTYILERSENFLRIIPIIDN